MFRPLLAALLTAVLLPASAGAVEITRTITDHKQISLGDQGVVRVPFERQITYDVAPADSDDDGCADDQDNYTGPGCSAPPVAPAPDPVAAPVSEIVAPDPAPVSSGYSIPESIVQCESGGDYGATNASGAYGAYQIMPETAANYGCDLSTPSGQDQCAGEIYAAEGASPWDCG